MADTEKKGLPFATFRTDKDKELDGVWVEYESGFAVRVARLNNPRYKEFTLKRSKPHMRKVQARTIDAELAEDIMKDAIAHTVLLDWRGLLDDERNEIPFSPDKARELFDEAQDFYTEMFQLCQQRELFAIEIEDGAAKK